MNNLFKSLSCVVLAISVSLAAGIVTAAPTAISYSGRLVDAAGKPLSGAVDLQVKFFDAETAGNALGPTKLIDDVVLKQGAFQIEIGLTAAEREAVFGSAGQVYIEVKNVSGNKTYPRQVFGVVPYALRVPVDGTTLGYNNDGELEVKDLGSVPSSAVQLDGGGNSITLRSPAGLAAPVTLTLPVDAGGPNQVLTTDGNGVLTWSLKATGAGNMDSSTYDIVGPADGRIDVGAGGTGANLSATGGAGQFLKQSTAGGVVTVGTIGLADLPAGAGTVTSIGITPPAEGLTASADITTTGDITLGLANDLAAVEGLTTTGIVRRTAANTWSTFADDSADWGTAYTERRQWDGSATNLNAGTARTSLGLVIGTHVQAQDAALQNLSSVATVADKLIYTSGADAFTTADLTLAGRALLDDADATAQRSTLGIGNVQNINVLNTFTQNDAQYLATDEIRARDAGGLKLFENGGTGLFVQDDGNVGIGTTSPGRPLHVGGTTDVTLILENTTAPANNRKRFINASNAGDLTIGKFADDYLSNSSHLRIDASGNVGIGTTSPTAKLHVGGTAGVDGIKFPDGTIQTTAATLSGGEVSAPAFRVYRAAAYNQAGNFKFDYDAEIYDTANAFDLSTNEFVTPIAGKYLFNGVVSASGLFAPMLQVNDVSVAWGQHTASAVGHHHVLTATLALTVGDRVAVYISNNGVTTWNNGEVYTHFAGTMLNYGIVAANASDKWGKLGDAGTVPGSNFIGTTDAQGFAVRTNNSERLRVDASGNVGIGMSSPGEKLTVAGTIESTTGGVKYPDQTVQTTAVRQFGAVVFATANQTIPNSLWTVVTWDTETGGEDFGGFHDNVTNNSRFTVPANAGGLYLICGSGAFEINGGGMRGVGLRKNGTVIPYAYSTFVSAGGGIGTHFSPCWRERLAVADYIEMIVFQNTGAGLALNKDFGRMSITYLPGQ